MGGKSSKQAGDLLTSVPPPHHLVQNCTLIWLDANIDENKVDCRQSVKQLKSVAKHIRLFTDIDQCLIFLDELHNGRAFFIVSGALSRVIVPRIHNTSHLDSIYILSKIKSIHESWIKPFTKIKGVFSHILAVCESLKQTVCYDEQSFISMSFVSKPKNINQLDPSFMYTQILKEILLEITFEEHFVQDLASYCRTLYVDNSLELKKISKFEREYAFRSPIWWYTYDCCIYSMLNRALRHQEVDTIVKMGFFIRDLHLHIDQLHKRQFARKVKPFVVYRGQSLSTDDFDKLMKTTGGLLSFNNFLSTTRKRDVALAFAHRAMQSNAQVIKVLFELTIHPSVRTAPFASLAKVSYYKYAEQEILFSMHTIFRIGDIQAIEHENSTLWQVQLALTNDNDEQLSALTETIRHEMQEEVQQKLGWPRLGNLLLRLGNFNAAEEVYNTLLKFTVDDVGKAYLYHQIGFAKDNQSQHAEAMEFYNRSLHIYSEQFPSTHPLLAICYKSIAMAHNNKKEYSAALLSHHKSLQIEEYILPSNHYSLATSYNSLGLILYNMKEHVKALLFYDKSLSIAKRILPANHPMFAISYNNIGTVYQSLEDYHKALWYYGQAVETGQRSLDANHPHLQLYKDNLRIVKTKLNIE